MKVALITGASSGIGAAAAIEFADAGWSVMAAGRDAARLDEVAVASENISTWEGDLESSEACDELVADTIEEFGRIDCLVNCAGILVRGNAADTSDEDWRDTMHVNLDVPFYLSRAALPYLLSTAGSIVNIASDWGLRAGANHVAYCASKGGLVMLTRAMAKDHAREGLRITRALPRRRCGTPYHRHGALHRRRRDGLTVRHCRSGSRTATRSRAQARCYDLDLIRRPKNRRR